MPVGDVFAESPGDTIVNAGIVDAPDEVFDTRELESGEPSAITGFLRRQADKLGEANQQLGEDFRQEIPNMLDVCRILKAGTDGKNFSKKDPRTPPSNGLAINMITPKDIEQPASTALQLFDLQENQTLTEGQTFYWWGGATATDFVTTTDPTSGDGYLVYIIDNGIMHEGVTPVARQFQFNSEDTTPDPWIANPMDTISVDRDRSLTRYETNGSYLINWEIGNNLRSVATRTPGNGNQVLFDMVGIVVYEEDYYSSLNTW